MILYEKTELPKKRAKTDQPKRPFDRLIYLRLLIGTYALGNIDVTRGAFI